MHNTNSRFITVLLLTMVSLFITSPLVSAAEKKQNIPDDEQPVNITADSLEASEKTGKSTYKGNVIIIQGSLTLKGETVNITHPNNQLTTVITNGNPATFKRYSQIDQAWIKGKAQKIHYNALDKTVLLTGDAMVEQPGQHVITGPRLFYNIDKQTLQAQRTDTENKRISVTLNPAASNKPQNQKPEPSEPKQPAIKAK